jgi:hypothetical protein
MRRSYHMIQLGSVGHRDPESEFDKHLQASLYNLVRCFRDFSDACSLFRHW